MGCIDREVKTTREVVLESTEKCGLSPLSGRKKQQRDENSLKLPSERAITAFFLHQYEDHAQSKHAGVDLVF